MPLKKPGLAWIVRIIAVVCITAMILLSATSLDVSSLSMANAQPLLQEATQYPPPIPTFDFGYPVGTETPTGPSLTPQATTGPGTLQPTLLPTLELTIQPTALPQNTLTLPPNTFLTENAEMGTSVATLDPNQTPGITMTATITSTPAPPTPQPTPILPDENSGGSDGLNWGFFWIGFSLPVLAGCGWVLYMLDRRPDLFRPHG